MVRISQKAGIPTLLIIVTAIALVFVVRFINEDACNDTSDWKTWDNQEVGYTVEYPPSATLNIKDPFCPSIKIMSGGVSIIHKDSNSFLCGAGSFGIGDRMGTGTAIFNGETVTGLDIWYDHQHFLELTQLFLQEPNITPTQKEMYEQWLSDPPHTNEQFRFSTKRLPEVGIKLWIYSKQEMSKEDRDCHLTILRNITESIIYQSRPLIGR